MTLFIWLLNQVFSPFLFFRLHVSPHVRRPHGLLLLFVKVTTPTILPHKMTNLVRVSYRFTAERRPSAKRLSLYQAQLLPRSSTRTPTKASRYQPAPMWVLIADLCAMLLISVGLIQAFGYVRLADFLPASLQFFTDSDKLLLVGIVLTIPYLRWAWYQLIQPKA